MSVNTNPNVWRGLAMGLLLLAVLATSTAPISAEVRYSKERCNFAITGEITLADVDELTRTSCGPQDMVHVLLFDSPGGDARAAMAIGRWLRDRNASVHVFEGSCHSSCALVYISGTMRTNRGDIGLHRPYLAGAPRSAEEVRATVASMLDEVRAYVAEMGVTPEFTNIMLNTPPGEMRVFRFDEIESLVPMNDPLHDELRTARSAKRHGLTTDEYRRRDAEAEISCAPRSSSRAAMTEALKCMEATKWGLSVSEFEQRHAAAHERCPQLRDAPDEELDAWEAAGHDFNDHPAAIAEERCIISVMQGL